MPQVFVKIVLLAHTLCPDNVSEAGVITGKGKIYLIIKRPFSLPFPEKPMVVINTGSYVPTRFIYINKGGNPFFDFYLFNTIILIR